MNTKKNSDILPDDDKLKELILYIVSNCDNDDTFGAVKLNKILFFADYLSYLTYGKPITGHEYQALPRGPAPRKLIPIREEMEGEDDVVLIKRQWRGHEQHRLIALREPDLSIFSAAEIALVDKLISSWWGRNANEISNKSHKFIGWQFARDGETIPYNVALVGLRSPTPDEIFRGLELDSLAEECLV